MFFKTQPYLVRKNQKLANTPSPPGQKKSEIGQTPHPPCQKKSEIGWLPSPLGGWPNIWTAPNFQIQKLVQKFQLWKLKIKKNV